MLYPFFALYITRRFGVGMTEVGILFALFSLSSFAGSFIGGALSDHLGRKVMLIFSLVTTSLSNVLMGLAASLETFYLLALLSGIFTETGGPARQAVVADLLPEKQRAQGFGILRVTFNVSAAIGPAIGGFLATRSYLALFLGDAVISLITAVILYAALPETKPQRKDEAQPESVGRTFRGYFLVLRDGLFLLFILASIFTGLTYTNMTAALGVFLRDVRGLPESRYGLLLTLNAAMVVVFQFWVTRRIKSRPPLKMMALGALLYAIGFAMYGFVSLYSLFLLAMAIITVGEMIIAPVSQAIVATFAPETMRGRYMAVFGISWGIPFAVGPYLAGLLMDRYSPYWVWYASGLAGTIAAAGYLLLHRLGHRKAPATA